MNTSIKQLILISLFSALTSIGAFFIIPIGFIPFTLQTFFVLLSGYILGGRAAAVSQVLYIMIGLLGLPVFTRGGSGLGHLVGPTGGYLLGFIASAFIVGKLFEKFKSPTIVMKSLIFFIGVLVIYIFGLTQLMLVASLNFTKAFVVGMFLFLPADFIKIIFLVIISNKIEKNNFKF